MTQKLQELLNSYLKCINFPISEEPEWIEVKNKLGLVGLIPLDRVEVAEVIIHLKVHLIKKCLIEINLIFTTK